MDNINLQANRIASDCWLDDDGEVLNLIHKTFAEIVDDGRVIVTIDEEAADHWLPRGTRAFFMESVHFTPAKCTHFEYVFVYKMTCLILKGEQIRQLGANTIARELKGNEE